METHVTDIQAFGKNLQQQGGQASQLLQQPRWVAWRAWLTESGYSKVPINISAQRPASIRCGALVDKHGKPQAVCRYTFDAALAAFAAGQCDGIGIATGEWDGLWVTGIDINHCLGSDGNPKKDLSDIVHMVACAGYCEVSPSATGIHGLVLAHKPDGYACRANGIEVYSDGQYLTVTTNGPDGRNPHPFHRPAYKRGLNRCRGRSTSPAPCSLLQRSNEKRKLYFV